MIIEVEFNHNDDEDNECTETIIVDMEYEPPDKNYGADADGNRGIYVEGYWYPNNNPPISCEKCGHKYTTEEIKQLYEDAEQYIKSNN